MARKIPPGPMSRKITAILREHQQRRGMSIRGLEAASGVNRGRVHSVLTDQQAILVDEIDALAHALGLVGWQVVFEAETGEPWSADRVADMYVLAANQQPEDPDDELEGQIGV